MVERSLPSRPLAAAAGTLTRPQSQRRSQRSATIPPPPPPHDDMVSLQDLDEKSHPLPPLPPLPPSKSFYNTAHFSRARTISPTFLENFMSRHPRISRHRRRFAVLLFTSVTAVLLLIVLLAVILSRKSGNGHGGDGGSVGDGGDYGDGPTASADELAKHNAGIPRPPINHSNATGWTSSGHGDGTFYDPSVKNSAGQFQEGACEYPFINSVHDLIVALNKPDFGPFKIASQSPACGQCLQVTGPNGTVQVQVVDMVYE
ncbi:hypothetical protein BGZ98_009351 [Dissophora globulifera]|nr:hypothetical protein BGZ98_009351 [Dissophora globulifera]